MQIITCQLCKEDILVIPDKKAMGEAIQNHAKTKHPELEYEVEDALTAELLKLVGV